MAKIVRVRRVVKKAGSAAGSVTGAVTDGAMKGARAALSGAGAVVNVAGAVGVGAAKSAMRILPTLDLRRDMKHANRLRNMYVMALLVIALLTLASQFFIHRAIKLQEADAPVIKAAAEQLTLSQQVTKAALVVHAWHDPNDLTERIAELDSALKRWMTLQTALVQGSDSLDIPPARSIELQNLYASPVVKDAYLNMVAAVQELLEVYTGKQSTAKKRRATQAAMEERERNAVIALMDNEADYLRGMSLVVNRHEMEAQAHIEELKNIENTLLAITLLTLLLEALFIFRPVVRKVHTTISRLENARNVMEEMNNELRASEEEIRMNMEELEATQDHLKETLSTLEKQHKELVEINQDVADSIRYARRIQYAILPNPKILEKYTTDNFVMFSPKDVVSGDFYWMAEEGGALYVVAADCTGHGVPGAFMSVLGISKLSAIVSEGYDRPGDVLEELHRRIVDTLMQDGAAANINDGMDIAIVKLTRGRETLEFAGAQRPGFLYRAGEFIEIKQTKWPIGRSALEDTVARTRDFPTQTVELQAGDRLYLFTDGITDQFDAGNDARPGKRGFLEWIREVQDLPPARQGEALHQRLLAWRGDTPQTDDVLVMGMQF